MYDPFPSTDTRVISTSTSTQDGDGDGDDVKEVKFIMTNNCNINDLFGITSFVTMVLVVLSVYYLNIRQKGKMVKMDEKQCTSADYTIEVKVS